MTRSAATLFAAVVLFGSCARDDMRRFARDSVAMDTYVGITLFDPTVTKAKADALIDSALAEIARIEQVMTDYSDDSEVGIVNRSAGRDTVEISEELSRLLGTSLAFSEQSDGAFDVSVGAMVKAWHFLSSEPEIPSPGKLRMLLRLTGYKNLMLDGTRVFLKERGMRIDLGGIAKGYAVDRAVDILRRNNIRGAIVDLGGNLGIWWEGTNGLDSTVAEILIRHPRKEGKFFGKMRVGTSGVSTSGDYQRFFVKDGIRYHHIISPRTGLPVRDVVSVTILAPDAMTADALSTLVFVLGRERGMEFIRSLNGVEGIIVWEDAGSLHYALSPGLQGKFTRSND